MAQFDVYANPDSTTADLFPYFVDIQHPIANLEAHRSKIIDVVDFLVQGF